MQPGYEARPSNGQNALFGIIAFGLLSLLFLFGVLGAILSAFTISVSAMINLPSRLFALVVCAGALGLCVRSYLAARKQLKAWQDGGGETRLAQQQAQQQSVRDAADREMYAALAARGVRFLAPYPMRRAGTDLEVYVDSELAQHLRPDEIVIDRAYGERTVDHWLVGVTNQRVFLMQTTFIGLTPAKKCLQLEVVELADVVQVGYKNGPLFTGISWTKRDGSKPWISISTVKVNTGFSNQVGFSRSYPPWAQATVAQLAQGASLRGGAPPAGPPAPAQAGPPRVTVRWPDGSLHPAVVLESRGDQCFCQFSDGRQQWIPASAVAPALRRKSGRRAARPPNIAQSGCTNVAHRRPWASDSCRIRASTARHPACDAAVMPDATSDTCSPAQRFLRHVARTTPATAADADDPACAAFVRGELEAIDTFEADGRTFVVVMRRRLHSARLSARERQTATLAAGGLANKLIACELGVTHATVANHLSRAAAKLGVDTRVALIQAMRRAAALRAVAASRSARIGPPSAPMPPGGGGETEEDAIERPSQAARATFALIVREGESARVLTLRDGVPITLGRDEAATLRIDERRVSRHHARVTLASGIVTVEDLGSRNGTQVNGDVLRGSRRPLAAGDTLRVGGADVLLVAQTDEATGGTPLATSPRAARPAKAPLGKGPVRVDPRTEAVMRLAERVATTETTVLILGETGVGKDVVARLVHDESPRRAGPFVRVNCAALPESLIEAELFGHERGAFTGAERRKTGFFEAASGGTILLDEIGELSPPAQAKLLGVLETKTFTRVGGRVEVTMDARVVAATHRDLGAEVSRGRFRQDLFYRLSSFVLQVPPLRERSLDVAPLAELLAEAICRTSGTAFTGFTDGATHALLRYRWPGNVRELRNAVEHALVMAKGRPVEAEDLPPQVHGGVSIAVRGGPRPVRDTLGDVERSAIVEALAAEDGNRSRAADRLGMSRRALLYKLQKYGI